MYNRRKIDIMKARYPEDTRTSNRQWQESTGIIITIWTRFHCVLSILSHTDNVSFKPIYQFLYFYQCFHYSSGHYIITPWHHPCPPHQYNPKALLLYQHKIDYCSDTRFHLLCAFLRHQYLLILIAYMILLTDFKLFCTLVIIENIPTENQERTFLLILFKYFLRLFYHFTYGFFIACSCKQHHILRRNCNQ